MADTLQHINAVSPELAVLIRKVKSIYVVCGGAEPSKRNIAKGTSAFDVAKMTVQRRIDNIESVSPVPMLIVGRCLCHAFQMKDEKWSTESCSAVCVCVCVYGLPMCIS